MLDLPDRVLALLARHGPAPAPLHHPPVRSAAHAAEVRGTHPHQGAKAIVMKVAGHGFVVLALRGPDRVAPRAFRTHLATQRFRFATRAELLDLTGLSPGGVPPFGRPIFDLPLFVDAALAAQPRVAFTLGRPDRSVIVPTPQWLAAATPADTWAFAAPPGPPPT